MLGRGLGHALQPAQLLVGLLLDLLRHAGLGDRLLQVLDLGRRALVLAQLLAGSSRSCSRSSASRWRFSSVPRVASPISRDRRSTPRR